MSTAPPPPVARPRQRGGRRLSAASQRAFIEAASQKAFTDAAMKEPTLSDLLDAATEEYLLLENHLFAPFEKTMGIGMSRPARAFFAIMPMFELVAIASAHITWAGAPFWLELCLTASSGLVFYLLATFAGLSVLELYDTIIPPYAKRREMKELAETVFLVWLTAVVAGGIGFVLLGTLGLSAFFASLSVALPVIWSLTFFEHHDTAKAIRLSGSATTRSTSEKRVSNRRAMVDRRESFKSAASTEATLRTQIADREKTIRQMTYDRQELIRKSFRETQNIREYYFTQDIIEPKSHQRQEASQNFSRQIQQLHQNHQRALDMTIQQLQRNHQRELDTTVQQLTALKSSYDHEVGFWHFWCDRMRHWAVVLAENNQSEILKGNEFVRQIRELELRVRELEMEKEGWTAL